MSDEASLEVESRLGCMVGYAETIPISMRCKRNEECFRNEFYGSFIMRVLLLCHVLSIDD